MTVRETLVRPGWTNLTVCADGPHVEIGIGDRAEDTKTTYLGLADLNWYIDALRRHRRKLVDRERRRRGRRR